MLYEQGAQYIQLNIYSHIKSVWLCEYYVYNHKLSRAKAHSLDFVKWHSTMNTSRNFLLLQKRLVYAICCGDLKLSISVKNWPGIPLEHVVPGDSPSMWEAIPRFYNLDTHTWGVGHHLSTILIDSKSDFLNINLGLQRIHIFLMKVCDFQTWNLPSTYFLVKSTIVPHLRSIWHRVNNAIEIYKLKSRSLCFVFIHHPRVKT